MDVQYDPSEKEGINYNFLFNTSNQGNLVATNNTSQHQINAVLVFIAPYAVENFNLEGLDIDLKTDEHGNIFINNKEFKTIEIKPGVSVLGIVQR